MSKTEELEHLVKCYKDEAEHWKNEYTNQMESIDPDDEMGWCDVVDEETEAFEKKRYENEVIHDTPGGLEHSSTVGIEHFNS